jgi:hypothetical protein
MLEHLRRHDGVEALTIQRQSSVRGDLHRGCRVPGQIRAYILDPMREERAVGHFRTPEVEDAAI